MTVVLHSESLRLGPGGQTIRLAEEAKRLNALRGWTCHVAGHSPGPLDDDLAGEPWYHPFRFNRSRLHPGSLLRALRLLDEVKPDILHTHSSLDAWIFGIAGRMRGIPIVRGRHSSWPIKSPAFRNMAYTHLADAFTVSGATIGRILTSSGKIREEHIFDTAGGFDSRRFDPDSVDRARIRRELGLTAESSVIGAVCMVRPTKGIDILVEAFINMLDGFKDRNVHLVVAGTVSEEDRSFLTAAEPSRIHFLGYRDDIEHVISGMDMLVVPSRKADGVPQVIPQAMALNVPVVGTRAGGIPDAVIHEETGFIVPPEDSGALSSMMKRVMTIKDADLAFILERARERALRRYTFDKILDKYIEAYSFLLGRNTNTY